MNVTAIMATCGRHHCAERSLSFFLNQTYPNRHLLIYQNSDVSQSLQTLTNPPLVTLINNHIDKTTGKPYDNLGAIYSDALGYIPADTEVIIFWDDDDLFLDDHIEEGVKGLMRGHKTAYKPAKSWFRSDTTKIDKVQNTLEPSIFVKAGHIHQYGFSRTTTDQHLQWFLPLKKNNDIFIDDEGKSTLIYNWGDSFDTFKTSGDHLNPDNFSNYRRYSKDHGDRIISPPDMADSRIAALLSALS